MNISKENIKELQIVLKDKSPQHIIEWAFNTIGVENIALASSLGVEDQVLTHYMLSVNSAARVFTLDTGRLHQETYSVMDKTSMKYGLKYELLFPDASKVEAMVSEHGMNLFYESVENRKLCCNVRKVIQLKKKLASLQAWITGIRKEQSVTRSDVEVIEWDEANNLVKLNPLANWTEQDVWNVIKQESIPYNKLFDKGFTSIGCVPCTRAVQPGEDVRAGRWWWESPEHKECGLHIK